MENQKFRTEKQFIQIMDNAANGNWSDAFQRAMEYGFYAHDLIKYYNFFESDDWYAGWYKYELKDLVYIAEGAQKLREYERTGRKYSQ
jgi:hypothetical protein